MLPAFAFMFSCHMQGKQRDCLKYWRLELKQNASKFRKTRSEEITLSLGVLHKIKT